MFKATLTRNILLHDGSNIVLVPKTVKNLPVNVFQDKTISKTKIMLFSNGLYQEIQPCDVILTIY